MRRYDAFTLKAKTAFIYTLDVAETIGHARFVCEALKYSLPCEECPFSRERLAGTCFSHEYDRTASEWLAWAAEEIEEDNNDDLR